MDEQAHLAAGLAAVSFTRPDLYPVNPPLVRVVAPTLLQAIDVKTD